MNTLIASGRADLCALARPHLADPYFTLHAAAYYQAMGYSIEGVSWPKQYWSAAISFTRWLAARMQKPSSEKLDRRVRLLPAAALLSQTWGLREA